MSAWMYICVSVYKWVGRDFVSIVGVQMCGSRGTHVYMDVHGCESRALCLCVCVCM